MSKSVVRGRIENFSPKPNEGYYGILVSEGGQDNWYNGEGNIPERLNKGDKVKLEVNKNRFCDIVEINVLESSASEDDASRGQSVRDGPNGSGESSTGSDDFIPKQTRIAVQTAFKETKKDMRESDASMPWSEEKRVMIEKTKRHYEVLEEVMKDVSGGGE